MSKKRKPAGRRGPTPKSGSRGRGGRGRAPRATRGAPERRWNLTRVSAAGLVVALILGLGAAALVATLQTTGEQEVEAPEVSGANLPELSRAGIDRAVGTPLPEVSGSDYLGEDVSFGPDDGPMVVLVVAHWCPECRRGLPSLRDWINEEALPSSVRMVTVSTSADSQRPNYPPGAWLDRERWPAPVVADDPEGSVAEALGVSGFPFWIFVDADGRVAERVSGSLEIRELEEIVDGLAAT